MKSGNAGWPVSVLRAGLLVLALALGQPPASAAAQGSAQDAAPGAGEADARALAKQRFQQAVSDYDDGRYEQALANFQEALRIRPHPLVNVNVANCYDKLGKPLQAIFHFQRFLESGEGAPAQRQEVTSALERLRKQVGQLLLRITPDGATVIIDQGEQRRAPILEPVQLEAGQHSLELKLAGYKTQRRTVIVRGGTTFELNLALQRENEGAQVLSVTPSSGAAPAEASSPPQQDGARADAAGPQRTPDAEFELDRSEAGSGGDVPTSVWIAGGISGALAVTALITGVLALSADSDFDAARDQLSLATAPAARLALYDQARDHADRAQALALTTDILLLATGGGVAVTAYLALTHDGGDEQPRTSLTPALSQHGAGMQLKTRF